MSKTYEKWTVDGAFYDLPFVECPAFPLCYPSLPLTLSSSPISSIFVRLYGLKIFVDFIRWRASQKKSEENFGRII